MLFGEISPSGKLPVTFYETLDELPEFTDYSMKGRTYRYMNGMAQFPFGYGLTYGHVEVTFVRVETQLMQRTKGDESIGREVVVAEVVNYGTVDTEEVVQAYVKIQDSIDAVPNPQLAAFARVFVKAGETAQVALMLSPKAFTVVDVDGIRREESGTYEIYVGCSQPDKRSAKLTGARPIRLFYMRKLVSCERV